MINVAVRSTGTAWLLPRWTESLINIDTIKLVRAHGNNGTVIVTADGSYECGSSVVVLDNMIKHARRARHTHV